MNAILLLSLIVSMPGAAPAVPGAGSSPDQLVQVGKAYANKGEHDKAIAALSEALKGKPKAAAEAEYLLGLCYSRKEMLPEAAAHLERSTALEPHRYEAWLLLGMTRDLSKDAAGAAEAYRKAIAATPERPEAHKELGATLLLLGKPEEAIVELEAALKAAPFQTDILGDLGYAQLMAKRCDEAVKTLQKADKRSADNLVHLGDGYACLGKTDEAIAAFDKAVALKADHARGLFHLGLMKMKKGDHVGAREALERAKKADPDNRKIGEALERLKAK
ncbi:MAG: tetratricopeptide repeat protein [Deltaproteobacteria bacterium]|nr:tetratricopeptide repeat protein [Deltaproteobacteria bacterium]